MRNQRLDKRHLRRGVIAASLAAAAVCATVDVAPESAGEGFEYGDLDRVLAAYVDDDGRVDYAALKKSPGDLEAYVVRLGAMSPDSHPDRFPDEAHQLAYWINAYNAFVLKGVVDAYPVASVKDIKILSGFFNRTRFKAGGRQVTLNDIEHGILRQRFREPRIHAAVNCASVGCPRLQQTVFHPDRLGEQLESAMRAFVRDPRHVRIDREADILYLSAILDWFQSDFTDWMATARGMADARVSDYVALYLSDEHRLYLGDNRDIEVRYLEYDWSLNEQKR